jgi:deferrochelatase/peroxidase EfeB
MAIISNPVSIELDDIQSLLIRGFGQLPVCTYILLEIEKPALAREWLTELLPFLSPATRFEPLTGLNIAFTHPGLAALGLAEENLRNFPIPFREGISASHRSRILGDYGASAPSQWRWGGEGRQPHCLLVLFARDEEVMARFQADHLARVTKAGGLRVVHQLDGYRRSDGKEQFGFHDSISQPVIKGSGRSGPDNDLIAPGEFVLGYLNEHAEYPFSPLIARAQGDLNLLPPDAAGSGLKDLGRNGTFLVYRQIQQHVDRFWAFMEEKTRKPDGQTDPEAQVRLAAKMVGRWPGGASLVKFPDGDPGIFISLPLWLASAPKQSARQLPRPGAQALAQDHTTPSHSAPGQALRPSHARRRNGKGPAFPGVQRRLRTAIRIHSEDLGQRRPAQMAERRSRSAHRRARPRGARLQTRPLHHTGGTCEPLRHRFTAVCHRAGRGLFLFSGFGGLPLPGLPLKTERRAVRRRKPGLPPRYPSKIRYWPPARWRG